jgi:hypothetical protein
LNLVLIITLLYSFLSWPGVIIISLCRMLVHILVFLRMCSKTIICTWCLKWAFVLYHRLILCKNVEPMAGLILIMIIHISIIFLLWVFLNNSSIVMLIKTDTWCSSRIPH